MTMRKELPPRPKSNKATSQTDKGILSIHPNTGTKANHALVMVANTGNILNSMLELALLVDKSIIEQ